MDKPCEYCNDPHAVTVARTKCATFLACAGPHSICITCLPKAINHEYPARAKLVEVLDEEAVALTLMSGNIDSEDWQ